MRIKISFILLFFVWLCTFTYAQTVKWSQQLQDNKKAPYMLILGENDNENIYVLRSNMSLENDREHNGFRNRTYLLQYFSPELAPLWEVDLKTSYVDGHISDVSLINGRVIVTSYISDKKTKRYYFYAQYIDDKGKWTGEPALLDSFSAEFLDENNKPGLISSHNQSLIAFSYRKISKGEANQSYEVIVMDTVLALKYKKEIEVPVSTQLFNPLNFILTDQGSFFILGIHYATEKRIKAPGESYYELFGYNHLMDLPVNTAIRSESKFLTDVSLSADNFNKNIVVAGFYSDKTTYSTAGVFYYSLTEDSLHETKTIQTPFSNSYLQKFLGERKENKELVNYSIDRLILRKDGGVALIAESVYQTNRSYFDYYMQMFISHTYYHYGDIMILSVNPNGNILWNNVITKDQNSVDDNGYYSGYFCAITGGRLVAIYNKYIDDDSSVLISYIDGAGEQKNDVLFNEIERVTVVPHSAKQIDDETILLPAYRQNKFYIVRISF